MGELIARLLSAIRRLFGRLPPVAPKPLPAELPWGPRAVQNDAGSYRVTIEPVTVPAGEWYWQAVVVHHFTPAENGGKHHLYLNLFEPVESVGGEWSDRRVPKARAEVTWPGGSEQVEMNKPEGEPGGNFPMWKEQIYSVSAAGLSGQKLPSEKVVGLSTDHGDEENGNSRFHHSFYVAFCKVQAQPDPAASVLEGKVHNGAGQRVRLSRAGLPVASMVAGANGAFRFDQLRPGSYTVDVPGTLARSDAVSLDGRSGGRIDVKLPPAQSAISGRVTHGAGQTISLRWGGSQHSTQVVTEDETYFFSGLPAGNYQLLLEADGIRTPPVALDGSKSVQVDLTAPRPDQTIRHYVLFGAAELPATRANLWLAQDFLLCFGPTFGFSAEEAARARRVTIIADGVGVTHESEERLVRAGAVIQRIQGPPDEVAAALAARIAAADAFA